MGGGNTAVEEALFLTSFASKVLLVHRRDELRAEKILQDRLFKNEKIQCIWDSQVIDIMGDDNPLNVTSVKIQNIKTEQVTDLKVDGIFVAIGHDPATQLFKGLSLIHI